jgi:hypothetical protein
MGRVSEDDTDWGQSAKGQLTRGRKQLDKRMLVIGPGLSFEEIGSGSRFRAGAPSERWEKMKQLARDGEVRFFSMDRISRLSRDDEEGIPFLNRCRDNGIWIHLSKTDQMKDLRIPAELEQLKHELVKAAGDTDQYSVDIIEGKRSARELGRPDGGIPWGLKRHWRPSEKHPGEMEYDYMEWVRGPAPVQPGFPQAPSRQELVLEIIRRVAAYWSYTSIKRSLEQRGILSPGGPRSLGRACEHWDVGTIKNIARSVLYLGAVHLEPATCGRAGGQRPERKYGTYDHTDPDYYAPVDWGEGDGPVVQGEDIKTFWAAVARVEDTGEAFGGGSVPRGGKKLNRKVVHLLTYGGMTCGYVWPEGEVRRKTRVFGVERPESPLRSRPAPGTVCGSGLRYGGRINGYERLICDEWGHNTVREDPADAYVAALVQARIAWLLRAGFDGRGGDELLRLRERLAAVDARRKECEAALEDPEASAGMMPLNRTINKLAGEAEALREKIRRAAVPVSLAAYDEVLAGPDVPDEDLAAAVAKVWLDSTVEARRAVLRGIAESVTLRPGVNGYHSRTQPVSERISVTWVPAERFIPGLQLAGTGVMSVGDGQLQEQPQ